LGEDLKAIGLAIDSVTVDPISGKLNYTFKAEKEGKEPFNNVIAKAEAYVREHPGMRITNINFALETVTVGPELKETAATTATLKSRVNDILFGPTGLIPKFIQKEMDDGIPLTEEHKDTIVRNYKLRKPDLSAEEIAEIERYFMQIDVNPYEVKQVEPEPEPQPKEEKGTLRAVGDWFLEFIGFGDNKEKPSVTETKQESSGKRDKYGHYINETQTYEDETGKHKAMYLGNNKWKRLY